MNGHCFETRIHSGAKPARESSVRLPVSCRPLVMAISLALGAMLFSGCEMLQQLSPSPSAPAAAGNFDKGRVETAATAAPTTAPPPPKKQAEFDAMMERLEKRGPAPTITPRSEPVAAAVTTPRPAVASPAAAASAPNHVVT